MSCVDTLRLAGVEFAGITKSDSSKRCMNLRVLFMHGLCLPACAPEYGFFMYFRECAPGLRSLYNGFVPTYMHIAPTTAIFFGSYDVSVPNSCLSRHDFELHWLPRILCNDNMHRCTSKASQCTRTYKYMHAWSSALP